MASCYAWITRVPVARPASSRRPNASPVGHPLHFHSTSLSRQLTDSNRRSLHAEQLLHNRERDGRAACPRPSPCPSPCCDPSPSGSSSLSPANQERCPFRSPFPQLQVQKQTRHKKKNKHEKIKKSFERHRQIVFVLFSPHSIFSRSFSLQPSQLFSFFLFNFSRAPSTNILALDCTSPPSPLQSSSRATK